MGVPAGAPGRADCVSGRRTGSAGACGAPQQGARGALGASHAQACRRPCGRVVAASGGGGVGLSGMRACVVARAPAAVAAPMRARAAASAAAAAVPAAPCSWRAFAVPRRRRGASCRVIAAPFEGADAAEPSAPPAPAAVESSTWLAWHDPELRVIFLNIVLYAVCFNLQSPLLPALTQRCVRVEDAQPQSRTKAAGSWAVLVRASLRGARRAAHRRLADALHARFAFDAACLARCATHALSVPRCCPSAALVPTRVRMASCSPSSAWRSWWAACCAAR
jgi:hypothetical protein